MKEPNSEFIEKMIRHIMKKYKLGAIDANCVFFDILTALQSQEKVK